MVPGGGEVCSHWEAYAHASTVHGLIGLTPIVPNVMNLFVYHCLHSILLDEITCPTTVDARGIEWKEAPAGTLSNQPCPIEYDGRAYRACSSTGEWEVYIDYTKCVLGSLEDIDDEVCIA